MSAYKHAAVGAAAGLCLLALGTLHVIGSALNRALNNTDNDFPEGTDTDG